MGMTAVQIAPAKKEDVKIVETQGNISFSKWVPVNLGKGTTLSPNHIHFDNGKVMLFPMHIQYVKDKDGGKALDHKEKVWFQVELNPVTGIKAVEVSKRDSEKCNVLIEFDRIKPGQELPAWVAQAVEKDLLPWLAPLVNGGFKDAVITRDESNEVVFVDRAGYHVYWDTHFVNVAKGNNDPSVQHQDCGRAVLDFSHGGVRVNVVSQDGKLVKAWKHPAEDEKTAYGDYKLIPPDIKEAATAVLAELKAALEEAAGIKARAEAGAKASS